MFLRVSAALFTAAVGWTVLTTNDASAALNFCNETLKNVNVAIGSYKNDEWISEGWWVIKPGECKTPVGSNLRNRYYYYYAYRSDGRFWDASSRDKGADFCISSRKFTIGDVYCRGDFTKKPFRIIDTKDYLDYTINIVAKGESLPKVETAVVQQRCLMSWDDSHQVHSVDETITWNYQAIKIRMKKLRHCIELKVVGPIDIGGVAKSYVDRCVKRGLEHQRTRYIIQTLASIGADVLATGGGATAATLASYIDSVVSNTLDCLTDTDQLKDYLTDFLSEKFDATVEKKSRWIYWNL